jgi:hypothetical protein
MVNHARIVQATGPILSSRGEIDFHCNTSKINDSGRFGLALREAQGKRLACDKRT